MNPLIPILMAASFTFVLALYMFWDEIEAWRFNKYAHKVLIPYVEEQKKDR